MLRVRLTGGQLVELPRDACFVEICTADGKPATVFAAMADGSVSQINPGTPEAGRYARAYGVEWAPTYRAPQG